MELSPFALQQKSGIAIIAFTGPGMALMSWAIPEVHTIPLWVLLTLAAGGGAVGMALVAPRSLRTTGVFCGILMGLGSFALHAYYSTFRSEMWNYESALVGILGAVPGIVLYTGLRKWKMRRLSSYPPPPGHALDPDLAALRDDPMFVKLPVDQAVVMSELVKRLLLIGCAFVGAMLTAFLILFLFSLSEYSAARAMPKCTVMSYDQFMRASPRTGWYRIQDCSIDLREAVYTLTPAEGNDPGGEVSYPYFPVHKDAGSKETDTKLVVTPANSVASTLYSQLKEIEAIRKSHPTDAAEILNAHPERYVLKRDIQGTLAAGNALYANDSLKKLSSCQPPLSHDFVVLTDGDNPSLSGALYNITLSTTLCAFTLPLFVFMLRRYRRAKSIY